MALWLELCILHKLCACELNPFLKKGLFSVWMMLSCNKINPKTNGFLEDENLHAETLHTERTPSDDRDT